MATTAPDLLLAPGGPFEQLCRALGGDLKSWREEETLDRLYIPPEFRCTVGQISAKLPELRSFVESYGEALENATLKNPSDPSRTCPLGPDLDEQQIKDLFPRRDPQPENELTLQADIVKSRFLAQILGASKLAALPGVVPVFVFFQQYLEKFFRRPTQRLEIHEPDEPGLWLHGPAQKIVLVVPEWRGFLEGPYLSVVRRRSQDGLGPVVAARRTASEDLRDHAGGAHRDLQ